VTETEIEWAKRLAAHPRWKWMAGMLGRFQGRVSYQANESRIVIDDIDSRTGQMELVAPGDLGGPDLADPATLGCLDAMLYEAGEGIVTVISDPVEMHRWHIMCAEFRGQHCQWQHHGAGTFATKGEALARAILAAWGAA
jgi:hypothetical protein